MTKSVTMFPSRAMTNPVRSWRSILEDTRVVKSLFNSMILSLTDGLTKEWCIATHLFWVAARRIQKRSGWLHFALYLKQCKVTLQKFTAGDKIPTGITPSVSLTRKGLPRIIPPFHRGKIERGEVLIIQLYISLFSSVSKLIPLAARVRKSLFVSITSPPKSIDSIESVAGEIRPLLRQLILRYVPWVTRIPLHQGMSFVPTWKAVPSHAWFSRLLRKSGDASGKSLKRFALKSSFTCFPYELAAFAFLLNFVHAKGEQFSQGCLWPSYVRFAFDHYNKHITNASLEWFEHRKDRPTSSYSG